MREHQVRSALPVRISVRLPPAADITAQMLTAGLCHALQQKTSLDHLVGDTHHVGR